MEAKMGIILYARKSKLTKDYLLPIYLRITNNRQRFDTSANRYVSEEKWSAQAGRVKGASIEAKTINSFLDALVGKAHSIERDIIKEGKVMSMDTFKSKWLGITEKPIMLMEVFQEHNDKMETLVGQDYAYCTFQRYQTSLQHTRDFLIWKFKEGEIELRKLNFKFITDYEFYLKSVQNVVTTQQ